MSYLIFLEAFSIIKIGESNCIYLFEKYRYSEKQINGAWLLEEFGGK